MAIKKLKKNLPPEKNLKSSFSLQPAEPVNEIGSDIFKYTPPKM
jgi:hypothetical protein